MTTRIERLRLFLCVALGCFISCQTVLAQESGLKFKPKLLVVDANEGIDLADIDGDDQLDVVAGRFWFQAPDFAARPLRLIKDWNGYVESNGDFCVDVDRDGLIDVVAGAFVSTEVHWYRNPGPEALKLGQLWQQELLADTRLSQNEASFLRDFDGDGQVEWISNSWNKNNPMVLWRFDKEQREIEVATGRGKKRKVTKKTVTVPALKKTVIGPANGHGIGFGDINNDGREDILFANGWYERPAGDIYTETWKLHNDWEDLHASCPMLVRDVDGDGKNDLVWGKGHDYGLKFWRSNGMNDSGKLSFEEFTIDDRYSQPHAVHFADLDGDGDDELISGKRVRAHNGKDPGGSEVACMYYYKWSKSDSEFKRFTIDEGHVGTGLQIRTGDLNGDGRLDIAVAGKDGTWLLFNQGSR